MATLEFEKIIEKACEEKEVPGVVLIATNRDGSFNYSNAFGHATVKDYTPRKPMQLGTLMYTASCTKLLTSLSVLHLAASQNFSLDDPTLLYKYIPELISFPIIQAPRDDGAPWTTPHTNPITLRHLLTHTSGFVYDVFDPRIVAWGQAHDKPPMRGSTVLERYDSPLAFEPGSSWMYGPSTDYAGLFIERVSGVALEEYFRAHIWEPLGIKDMTFHLSQRPDLKERVAEMAYRRSDTGKVSPHAETPQRVGYLTPEGEEVSGYFGGDGLFATAEEYIKVLRGVLDTSIIPPSFVEDFFTPQMNEAQADMMNGLMQIERANYGMCGTNPNVRKNWGLGGMLLGGDDHPGGRKEGTMVWSGLPMLAWFIDRKTGLCGLFGTQVLPTGDKKAAELARVFEDGVYALYEAFGKARL